MNPGPGESEKLEKTIGYSFLKKELLEQALTHSSYSNENGGGHQGSNERMEFLGDAVLELVSSVYLFERYPEVTEGELTRKRASMVCEPSLAYCAKQIGLGDYLLLGNGEDQNGGRFRDSVVSDALEALIGAVYLDGGFDPARALILKHILEAQKESELFRDSKTQLQEYVQGKGLPQISYKMTGESGPDHNKVYTAVCMIGEEETGSGTGHTKKAAEQEAARISLEVLKRNSKNER